MSCDPYECYQPEWTDGQIQPQSEVKGHPGEREREGGGKRWVGRRERERQ